MLVSHSHKFIFLHNYKVAGSSVKRALSAYSIQSPCNWHKVNSFLGRNAVPLARVLNSANALLHAAPKLHPHSNAQESQDFFPNDIWENYYKFGFVRNPWDWQVSMYHFMRSKKDHFQHELVSSFTDFEEYLEWRVASDLHIQLNFFKDASGTVAMDFIGKLEHMENDFSTICNTVGLSCKLPFVNKTEHRNYKAHYNERSRKLVADHFMEDIDTFEYRF